MREVSKCAVSHQIIAQKAAGGSDQSPAQAACGSPPGHMTGIISGA